MPAHARARAGLLHAPHGIVETPEFMPAGTRAVPAARPWRRAGELVDLPAAVLACAEDAGLIAYEANVALLTGLRGDSLVPSVSFFQLEHARKARAAGTLHLAIAHEDILVLRNPI